MTDDGRNRAFYEDAYSEARAMNEWQPTETAPRDGTMIQGWIAPLHGGVRDGWWQPVCRYHPDNGLETWGRNEDATETWDGNYGGFHLLAWMPHPKAPGA